MNGNKTKKSISQKIIEIKIMEIQGITEWTLTKNMVENELGKEISDDEFVLFGEHFKDNFKSQLESTLESQASNWEEIKTLEL